MQTFTFPLTADDEQRNNDLLTHHKGYNKVIFGGLVLAFSSIETRRVTSRVDTRSWFTKKDAGIDQEVSREYVTNSDGTRSEIVTTINTADDGSVTTTTVETVSSSVPKVTTQTTTTDRPLVDPSTAGLGRDNDLWLEKIDRRITTTVREPSGSTQKFTTVRTDVDPENPKTRYTKVDRYTDSQEVVELRQPHKWVSINGTVTTQWLGPPPEQGNDLTYWDDDMRVKREETQVDTVDNEDGTRTTTTTSRYTDVDGYYKEVIEEKTEDIEPEEDDNVKVTRTVTDPVSERVTERLYRSDNSLISEKVTTTQNYDSLTGEGAVTDTTIIETTTDDLGKVVRKETKTTRYNLTGVENTVEVEEIIEPGQDRITYNRSIERNLETGKETVNTTVTRTTGRGETITESQSTTSGFSKQITSTKRTKEAVNDEIIDDLVNGFIITEYQLSGELMSMPQQFKIKNKYFEHQLAHAFLQVTEDKLSQPKLSPAKKRQLYKDWQVCFYGEPGGTVMGGPVLDRIDMYIMGEHVPVVFNAAADSFKAEYIPGSYGLYRWSMTVSSYKRIVRDRANSYGADMAGGYYGRSDNEHWMGGHIVNDLGEEIQARKDVEDGGQWDYR